MLNSYSHVTSLLGVQNRWTLLSWQMHLGSTTSHRLEPRLSLHGAVRSQLHKGLQEATVKLSRRQQYAVFVSTSPLMHLIRTFWLKVCLFRFARSSSGVFVAHRSGR